MLNPISERVEKLADEIIQHSDGACFIFDEPEGIEHLTKAELLNLWDIVFSEIDTCDGCGWWGSKQDMEESASGNYLCWQCFRDEEEEEQINEE